MDAYLDYDDFAPASRVGGGGSKSSGPGANRKRGGKSGSASNDTGSGTIYNSKHIRVGQTKRENTNSKRATKSETKKNRR
jgi:hypothetical protein